MKNLFIAGSLLALANLPANAELLIGISFPSQGGGDDDAFEIDDTLLTLPKLHLQDAPFFGPENINWSSDPTIKFSTTYTYTEFYVHYFHQDAIVTNLVFPSYSYSYSYSFVPGKFGQGGPCFTGLTVREQLPQPPLSGSVSGKVTLDSSGASDSSISGSVSAAAFWPATGLLTVSLNQNTLQLDWPADHIGWTLQTQTNPGINSQWFPILGSSATNHFDLTLDRANTSVFFRLVAP